MTSDRREKTEEPSHGLPPPLWAKAPASQSERDELKLQQPSTVENQHLIYS